MNRTSLRVLSSLVLGGFCLTPLLGCKVMDPMVMLVDEKYGGGNYKRALELNTYLTEERDELQGRYDAYVKEADDYIATKKPQIEAHIEAGEIGPALVKLTNMDNKLHPADGQRPPKGIKAVVAHSGRAQRDYIRDAASRTLGKVDEVMASGKFQLLDVWLAKHSSLSAMDDATREGFEQKQAQLNELWLAALVKASERTKSSHPGSSLVYALKGQELAEKLGDDTLRGELGSHIETLKDTLESQHGYVFSLGELSGTHSRDVAGLIEGTNWGARRIRLQKSNASRVHGVLHFAIDDPKYSRSTSEKTDSFRYKSGTRQVANPAYESAQSDVERFRGDVEREQSNIKNMRRDTQGWENNLKSYERSLQQAQSDLARAQGELSSLPATVTEDVFDDYTYPVTVHTLRTSWNLTSRVEASPSMQLKGNVSSSLSDEEHGFYSKNDGGVEADPANPPPKSKGLAGLRFHTAKELRGLLGKSFAAYQQSILSNLPEGREDRIDRIALHIFLDPNSADKEALAELDELADVNGMTRLFLRE